MLTSIARRPNDSMENKGTILKANFKALLRGFSDLKAWAKDADAN